MFHKSDLEHFGEEFPQDSTGYVPAKGDCWRQMKFDHADMDPNEEGISAEEKKRRLEYLDTVWWPKVLQKVHVERQRLEAEHGETFIKRWHQAVNRSAEQPHGFGNG
ncbi:hypothetical protein [Novipirellula rosea]|uniref:Uncharacterized protein n=1 Tax=Novipirellula rosea TaxID=1031540 RepID=A0ABP8N297_9BACT|tara:strand:+ start:3495 stop:3815 length:321 start_codon:yes stop_codon:yes gene_type:complete